jgi:predicted phosphodiesterase
MAEFHKEGRFAWVEGSGNLIVVSDLHGNLKDFLRIVAIFEQEKDACLLFLGDLFHGPYLTRDEWAPYIDVLGDFYYDQSAAVFRCFIELYKRYPNRVCAILGNHEHAHVGGPRVSKFTEDEAMSFEAQLSHSERRQLYNNLSKWPWMVASKCGACFTHGAPPPTAFTRKSLEEESLEVTDPQTWVQPGHALLSELLWRRYSPPEDVQTFLSHLNGFSPYKQNIVCYGHEPSPEGYEIEHPLLFNLSSSFAMQHDDKTYLHFSLSEVYFNAYEVEMQIKPLYDDSNRVLVFPDFNSLDEDTMDDE